MSVLGIDVARWQSPAALPWAEWVKVAPVCVVQVAHGAGPEPNAAGHLERALAAGYEHIGAYHFLTADNVQRQVTAFLAALDPAYQFAALDIEQGGVSPEMVVGWCALFAAQSKLPLVLYGNNLLAAAVAKYPTLAKYPVWWAAYPTYPQLITDPPSGWPTPAGLNVIGWQYGGNNGRLPPYTGEIDLTIWKQVPGMPIYPVVRKGSKVALHSINMHTVGALAEKFARSGAPLAATMTLNDASQNARIKTASSRTITITRYTNPTGHWENIQDPQLWDDRARQQFARDSINLIFNNANQAQLASTDYFTVCNEPSHVSVKDTVLALFALCSEATRRGVRLTLPTWSQGVPEWADMLALADPVFIAAMLQGGHIFNAHEGPTGSNPVDQGYGATIPGAPVVAGAGAYFMRYQYQREAFRQKCPAALAIPWFFGETYYGGPNYTGPIPDLLARVKWVDDRDRQDNCVLARAGYSIDVEGTRWTSQDYGPLMGSQAMLEYLTAIAEQPNGETTMPVTMTDADFAALAALVDKYRAPSNWWDSLPAGVLTPARKTTNMQTALDFYHLPTDTAPYTTRTYAAPGAGSIDVYERSGAFFRVTTTPAIWVPAGQIRAFS